MATDQRADTFDRQGTDVLLSTLVFGRGGGHDLSLHLLRPWPLPARPLPVVIWVHGGAWRVGNKDGALPRLLPFVRRGYAAASVEYRLSGEARFPAPIEDCKCAVRFLRVNAASLGLDPERFGAWGDSAGGHLVALLGTAPDEPALEGTGGWPGISSRVQAVCDWYGPTDFLQMVGQASQLDHAAPDAPEAQLLGGPIQEVPDRVAQANPISYVSGDAPPFLIVHGDKDPVIPLSQSQLLYEALMNAGADVTFHTLHGGGHGGPAFDHPATRTLVQAFFDRHLQPEGVTSPPARPGSAPAPAMTSIASKAWVAPDTAPERTTYRTFASRAAGEPVGYACYLPPGYDNESSRRYPVIYWLHGLGGDPRRGGTFVRLLDQAIRDRVAPPAIAILVNGLRNGFYCDAANGKWPVERVLIAELLPHVDATYRTIPTREGRAIEGQSMGGFGAARLGFGHPELFGAVSISAGALLDADRIRENPTRQRGLFRSVWGEDFAYFEACSPWHITRQNADAIRGRTAVRVVVGDQDRLLGANERYHQLLDELGIAHTYTVVPGAGHGYDEKFLPLGVGSFAFFADAFAAG